MKVLIASSATGGHIYPALAIAGEIKRRDPEAGILFVGAKWEIGKDIVKEAGYRQAFIDVSGIDRRNPVKALRALAGLARASREISGILREFKPDVCIGTGGHVAGPVVREAKKAGVRTLIQEQNVIPGMANKLAERYADLVFVGFEEAAGYFRDKTKVIVSGNPVRADFAEAALRRGELRAKYGVRDEEFCVLFFGGSQGAAAINAAAVETVRRAAEADADSTERTDGAMAAEGGSASCRYIIITGRGYYDEVCRTLAETAPFAAGQTVIEYSDRIYELFAAADLIVSRSGALTVAEIAQSGKASILIPSPNVTNNHQYYNARALADAGAAVLMPEDEIREGGLAREIKRIAEDPKALESMGMAARAIAKEGAAKVIVDAIFGS